MNKPVLDSEVKKSNFSGFEIVQNEIRFYRSRVIIYGGFVFILFWFIFLVMWMITSQPENKIFTNIIFTVFLILLFFLSRESFNKKPSIVIGSEGFFSRKTGKLLWQDIKQFNYKFVEAAEGGGQSILLEVHLTDGEIVNVNTFLLSIDAKKISQVAEEYRVSGHDTAALLLK